ncbi:DUF4134 family protein [Porphyromonas levii]|uniref:DUF4134 domain-containing protein n=1 Tax=Porphyromonas levii TaxID=28114 RepID=A0A4Y8WMW4_9PORP|nr:DUF4134 family protein [Porphyromonas levii]MBR8801717.1 hypothetical protein [Porphyromonas levii]TFH94058.1 DUF4134 domain-containing protein [Porphyromonas levii]TFH96713.1 DUF4134 domain-containing protein [Porphyromonas levii]
MKQKILGISNRVRALFARGAVTSHRVFYLGALGLLPASSYAQIEDVNNALSGVKRDLSTFGGTVIGVVKILVGVLAVVALVTLVVKFQEGDHEAKKKLTMWLGALVIFFVALTVIEQMFSLRESS